MNGLCAHDNIVVTVEGEVVVGRRLRRRARAGWRAQASPTRPEQPSLASVVRAGARHARVTDTGG